MDKKEAASDTSLRDDALFLQLKEILGKLGKKHSASLEEIFRTLQEPSYILPLSIFDNEDLSILESVCKYLKESQNLSYAEIGRLLNRSQKTIWTSCSKANKKHSGSLPVLQSSHDIPLVFLQNREFTVFESIVRYLKDVAKLHYSEIAALLHRDQRNIWTVYNRKK